METTTNTAAPHIVYLPVPVDIALGNRRFHAEQVAADLMSDADVHHANAAFRALGDDARMQWCVRVIFQSAS